MRKSFSVFLPVEITRVRISWVAGMESHPLRHQSFQITLTNCRRSVEVISVDLRRKLPEAVHGYDKFRRTDSTPWHSQVRNRMLGRFPVIFSLEHWVSHNSYQLSARKPGKAQRGAGDRAAQSAISDFLPNCGANVTHENARYRHKRLSTRSRASGGGGVVAAKQAGDRRRLDYVTNHRAKQRFGWRGHARRKRR